MTAKKWRFVEEYIKDLNATQAAIRAGYSARTAASQGERLLRDVDVQAALQEAMKQRSERTKITADNVLRELAAMTFYDAGEIGRYEIKQPSDIEKLPEELRRCVVGWSWDKAGNFTLKLADKLNASGMAMRHLGLFNDKLIIQKPKVSIKNLTGRKNKTEER